MQIKATVRYYLIPVRMAIINKSIHNKRWQRCGERGTLWHCCLECRLVQPLWKSSMQIPQKIKNGSAFWPSDPTSGNISKGTQNTNSKEHNEHLMFIAALFTFTKIWKQLKCPSIHEWINQLWDIYTMEFYLAVKKKILPFVRVWMGLENIRLSKINQSKKDKYHMISLMCGI